MPMVRSSTFRKKGFRVWGNGFLFWVLALKFSECSNSDRLDEGNVFLCAERFLFRVQGQAFRYSVFKSFVLGGGQQYLLPRIGACAGGLGLWF